MSIVECRNDRIGNQISVVAYRRQAKGKNACAQDDRADPAAHRVSFTDEQFC
jgi:hypothetical protein